jgi:hypothetical protein
MHSTKNTLDAAKRGKSIVLLGTYEISRGLDKALWLVEAHAA